MRVRVILTMCEQVSTVTKAVGDGDGDGCNDSGDDYGDGSGNVCWW